MRLRKYQRVHQEIQRYIRVSTSEFDKKFIASREKENKFKLGVIKYFHPKFLEGFIAKPHLKVSNTSGFTWGDGVYVTPLEFPKSGMMYGRVGVLGWYDTSGRKIYDAISNRGLELYQEWITHQVVLYRELTITVHAEIANRLLRNRFKNEFEIDLVYFRPDEEGYHPNLNAFYTDKYKDIWLAITDRLALNKKSLSFTQEILDCRWVSVLMNEFEEEGRKRRAFIPVSELANSWPTWFNDTGDLLQKYLEAYEAYPHKKATP